MSDILSASISRRTLLLGLAAGGVGSLIACSPNYQSGAVSPVSSATQAPNPDARVVIGVSRDLGNGPKDPYFTHTSLMVHEPLIRLGDGLEPMPGLAEKWSVSEDGLRWTFNLRRGVKFHDGTDFNAAAAIKNLERNIAISPRTSPYTAMNAPVAYGPVAEIRAVDDYTFEILHKTPYPLLEATMSNFFSAMFSPASFAANGDFTGIPAATGPFILKEWVAGQSLELERFDGYWGTKAQVKTIQLRVIPDANTRVSSLIANEIEAIVELGAILPAQVQQLTGKPEFAVGSDPISITQYLFFNCGKAPFNDVRLRQALVMALDLPGITKDIVLGYGEPGKSLISAYSTRWVSAKGTPVYDPAKATVLARQALGDRRVEATFAFTDSPGQARPYKDIAAFLQSVVRPLGIDIRLQQLESAALTDATNRGEWDMRFSQLGWANGDPDFIMGNFMYSKGGANTTSKGGYANTEVDRLVEEGREERDFRKRHTIYERIQEIAATEVPVVALYHEKAPYAYRTTLRNLRQRINFQPTFDTMTKS